MSTYTVRVTRTRTIERSGKRWLKVTDDPEPGQNQYGYIEATLPEEEEVTLYEQTVEQIDLRAVINAVNIASGS